jgi:hypothetical protein
MMFKRTMFGLSVAILTLTVFAQAQESATLVTKSGERISGQLVDMGGVGFTIKVNGADKQVPTNDVAVIEFSGGTMTDADWAKIQNGQQVVMLKNGDIVQGRRYVASEDHRQDGERRPGFLVERHRPHRARKTEHRRRDDGSHHLPGSFRVGPRDRGQREAAVDANRVDGA